MMTNFFLDCCQNAAQVVKCSSNVVAATSDKDVQIVDIICGTVVWVVGIAFLGFLLWKLIDHTAQYFEEKRKRTWEVQDIERKGTVEKLQKELDELKKK